MTVIPYLLYITIYSFAVTKNMFPSSIFVLSLSYCYIFNNSEQFVLHDQYCIIQRAKLYNLLCEKLFKAAKIKNEIIVRHLLSLKYKTCSNTS